MSPQLSPDARDDSRPRVAVVGRGNVGSHLGRAFTDVADVITLDPHQPQVMLAADADFIILAVSDSAVAEVAEHITGLWAPEDEPGAEYVSRPVMVHTSGSMSADALSVWPGARGVLYPLQTFSKDRGLDYSRIPFFIEGDTPDTEEALAGLARLISKTIRHADSERRAILHLGAVFACNFANALWDIADEILSEGGYTVRDMLPLIEETVAKLETLTPRQAQTGPAARGDMGVIERQEKALVRRPVDRAVYKLLTEVIMKHKDAP